MPTRLLAAALLLSASTSAAQTPPAAAVAAVPPAHAAAIAAARHFVSDTMRALGAPGASVTVMKAGKVIWSEGFGWADLEQQVPVTPLTKFRVGSVSKSLTATALGRLVEDGKLDLDQPVQRYVPSFPAKRWPITTRQVAGHLAGIRHYRSQADILSYTRYRDVLSSLSVFRDDSLLFQPGTRFAYSSFGWNLISAVLEAAGGEPFLQLMQRSVFDAAEMRHTVADYTDSIIPNRARWYTRQNRAGGIVNADYTDNSYKWAGGGFLSTTEDLVAFADAMLHGRLLKPATVEMMWTSQRLADGKASGYGIGWFVDTDKAGRRRVWHSGGSVGGTAYLVIYPEQDLIVSVLVNSDWTFAGATPAIAEMFLREDGR